VFSLLHMEIPQECYLASDLKVGDKGIPSLVFPSGYVPTVSACNSLQNGMGPEWTTKWSSFVGGLKQIAEDKIPTAVGLGLDRGCGPHLDEVVTAIVLYTCDTRTSGGNVNSNPYLVLNNKLRARQDVEEFKSFLYYLVSGLTSLPPWNITCYRGESSRVTAVSPQYVKGNHVIWVAITSASLLRTGAEDFVRGKSGGTLYIITATHARDISKLSLYPQEAEVILTPNSVFKVADVEIASGDRNYDIIHLKQLQ